MKIALIGAGNLATNLGAALLEAGEQVCQVYSRTLQSAERLADTLGCEATDRIEQIVTDATLYIVALKDAVLPSLLPLLVKGREKAVWVHTAGSIPLDIWKETSAVQYGVFYPMQTFSKMRRVKFSHIPVFLEASDAALLERLKKIAACLSDSVYVADSEQRRFLHLSAVFACNFTNALYGMSEHLLKQHGIPFEVMLPLIDETAQKVHSLSPVEAQTGPAVRYDRNVMDKQLALLEDEPDLRQVYELLSDYIHKTSAVGG